MQVTSVVYCSYHAFVERDDVEAGRTCPRAKAGPVKAPEPAIPATSATPVNTHGFTIVTIERAVGSTGPVSVVYLSAKRVSCESKSKETREQRRTGHEERNSSHTPSESQGIGDTNG